VSYNQIRHSFRFRKIRALDPAALRHEFEAHGIAGRIANAGERHQVVADVMRRLDAVGAKVTRDATSDLLLINGEFSASMVLSRCRETPAGSLRWLIQINRRLAPDVTILVRMDSANAQPTDYYLLPIMDIEAPRLLLCETNGVQLDTYQFDNLDYLAEMATRSKIEEVA
jgi:hypothetical protein